MYRLTLHEELKSVRDYFPKTYSRFRVTTRSQSYHSVVRCVSQHGTVRTKAWYCAYQSVILCVSQRDTVSTRAVVLSWNIHLANPDKCFIDCGRPLTLPIRNP